MKNIVLFGAGKIGRSFIGQIFSRSGYEVVFVDTNEAIIDEINRRRSYDVVIKDTCGNETMHITNVRGLYSSDRNEVARELADCDMAAVSVGQKGLPDVAGAIVSGLKIRHADYGVRPLDIILAENMRNASGYMYSLLEARSDGNFPLEPMTGLIETGIGKMVPIMPADVQADDPLLVYTEAYNTLVLDKKAFKNPIPDIGELAPKENIKAWVDRKSYIHNFGHAAGAYFGYMISPGAVYMYEVLEIREVYDRTKEAMRQSADILMAKYPGEFTHGDLYGHIDDLLWRFSNRALGDTVFRVGCDLRRKLGYQDRILSPLSDGIKYGLPVDRIVDVFKAGLGYLAVDENGNKMPSDVAFISTLNDRGIEYLLEKVCGIEANDTNRLLVNMIMGTNR